MKQESWPVQPKKKTCRRHTESHWFLVSSINIPHFYISSIWLRKRKILAESWGKEGTLKLKAAEPLGLSENAIPANPLVSVFFPLNIAS